MCEGLLVCIGMELPQLRKGQPHSPVPSLFMPPSTPLYRVACFLTAHDSKTLKSLKLFSWQAFLFNRKKQNSIVPVCLWVVFFTGLQQAFGFRLSFSVARVVMLAFMLGVVNFVSLTIVHFLLESHGGMMFRTSEYKYSIYYILAFDFCNTSLSVISKIGLQHFVHFRSET